jgi:Na+/proline symporter
MLDIRPVSRRDPSPDAEGDRPRRTTLIAHSSSLIASFCGFVTVFGVAHLLLIHITKLSGYVFFGTLATVPLLIAALLWLFTSHRRTVLTRFGFGALMCACAIPVIYLARFAPESARSTVRNLLGLPFFILTLIGPFPFLHRHNRNAGV